MPSLGPSPYPNVPPTVFTILGILKLLNNINPQKANGPDLIPCHILKEAATEIAPKLMGHTLKSVSHYPYLGVEISCKLDWRHHISSKVTKANQTLGFLRRNLGNCPESTKELAYKA